VSLNKIHSVRSYFFQTPVFFLHQKSVENKKAKMHLKPEKLLKPLKDFLRQKN